MRRAHLKASVHEHVRRISKRARVRTADGNVVTLALETPQDGPTRIVLGAGTIPITLTRAQACRLAAQLIRAAR